MVPAALVVQACGCECVGFGWLVGGSVDVRNVPGWMKQGRAWLVLVLRGAGGVVSIRADSGGEVLRCLAWCNSKILRHAYVGEMWLNMVIDSMLIYVNIFGFCKKKEVIKFAM